MPDGPTAIVPGPKSVATVVVGALVCCPVMVVVVVLPWFVVVLEASEGALGVAPFWTRIVSAWATAACTVGSGRNRGARSSAGTPPDCRPGQR